MSVLGIAFIIFSLYSFGLLVWIYYSDKEASQDDQ